MISVSRYYTRLIAAAVALTLAGAGVYIAQRPEDKHERAHRSESQALTNIKAVASGRVQKEICERLPLATPPSHLFRGADYIVCTEAQAAKFLGGPAKLTWIPQHWSKQFWCTKGSGKCWKGEGTWVLSKNACKTVYENKDGVRGGWLWTLKSAKLDPGATITAVCPACANKVTVKVPKPKPLPKKKGKHNDNPLHGTDEVRDNTGNVPTDGGGSPNDNEVDTDGDGIPEDKDDGCEGLNPDSCNPTPSPTPTPEPSSTEDPSPDPTPDPTPEPTNSPGPEPD